MGRNFNWLPGESRLAVGRRPRPHAAEKISDRRRCKTAWMFLQPHGRSPPVDWGKMPWFGNIRNQNESSGKICAGNGVILLANGWGASALPDIPAAGAGHRVRGILLFHGFPANRTIFLPHSLHLTIRWRWARNNTKLARASFAGPVNFEISLGVRGRGD